MPIATSLALGLGALSIGGSVASGIIGSRAAGRAANVQATAANRAAELQARSAREALDFQREQYDTDQANFAPWLNVGTAGVANLAHLMGITPQSGGGTRPTTAQPRAGGGLPPARRPDTGFDTGRTPEDAYASEYFGEGEPGTLRQLASDNTTGARARAADLEGRGGVPSAPQPSAGPVATSGSADLSSLVNPELGGFGSLMQPFGRDFVPPTDVTQQNDPGYQFRLQEGLDALQHSAAARGGLLTGATAEAMTRYGQDYASGEYGNVYNRALTEYETAYNAFQQNQSNQFNRLASMSGMGQTAAGQLSASGNRAAGNVGNILLSSARDVGDSIQQAGAARASGYVDQASQWQNALRSSTGNLQDLLLMRQRRPLSDEERDRQWVLGGRG